MIEEIEMHISDIKKDTFEFKRDVIIGGENAMTGARPVAAFGTCTEPLWMAQTLVAPLQHNSVQCVQDAVMYGNAVRSSTRFGNYCLYRFAP